MNIKDFLIDNYIWILAIILISIVTIIGFLADKKKNGKKNDNQPVPNPVPNNGQPMNHITPIQYNAPEQIMQNQMNNNNNLEMNQGNFNKPMPQQNQNNGMINSSNINNENHMGINNITPLEPTSTMPVGVNNTINTPNPIENIIPNNMPEPIYQPLSEQTPFVQPRPVQTFNNFPNNNQEMVTPIENTLNQSNPNFIPQMGQSNFNQQNIMQDSMQNESVVNYIPGSNNISNSMTPPMNNNNINVPNYNQNNTTTPEVINAVPMPQPVNTQPIMHGMYNNGPLMQPNNFNNPMPQQNLNPQQTQLPNQPINFVYGPQNNNPNM